MSGAVLDLSFALLAAFLAFRGAWRGFSGEVLSLAGTVGGCLVAWRFGPGFATILVNYLNLSLGFAVVLALVALFLAVVVGTAFLGKMVQALLRFTSLTLFDRLLGLVTGLVKTFLVLLLFYGGVLFFSPLFSMEWAAESRAMDIASRGWPVVETILDNTGLWPSLEDLPSLPGESSSAVEHSS